MRAGPLVLLALSVAPAFAAPGSSGSPSSAPSLPRSITEIRFKLRAADEKLTALLEAANVDAALKDVRTYKGYKAEQLQLSKKPVTADRLLQIVQDKEVSAETREEAAHAIFSDKPLLFDPDLSTVEARRRDQARSKFSLRVVKLLSNADLWTRSLANQILGGLWVSAADPAIHGYDGRKKESWGPARAAWLEYLNK